MLREPARVLNKRFEREPSKETGYKQFCGIFDLVYRVAGQETRTLSKKDVRNGFECLFSSMGCKIWWIVHDKDEYNGELKIAHVHFVLDFHRKRRWNVAFREICECFGLPHEVDAYDAAGEAVMEDGKQKKVLNPWLTLSACCSPIGAIRYLVHADDHDKHQYPFSDLVTNDLAMAKMAMLCESGALTSDVIANLVWECHGNVRNICCLMGLDYFSKYNAVIRMLVAQYRYENDGAVCKPDDKEDYSPLIV